MTRRSHIIRWFLVKRSLIGQIADLNGIVAKQVDEITGLRRQAKASRDANDEWTSQLQASIGIANDQVRRLTAERDDLRGQNVRVRNALRVLRDDLHRAEQATPVRSVGITHWPERIADVIAQETAAKRQQDGLGDPA